MKIRIATGDDAADIAAGYAPFVTDSAVSFETEAPDAQEIARRIESGGTLHPWLVIDGPSGELGGWASASAFRPRAAYRFAVETSIYLLPGAQGFGLGRRLYSALIELLIAQGFTQAIAAITLPNPASVALHQRLGFEIAGTYRDIGFKQGEWRSVALWQRPLAPMTEAPQPPRPFDEVWRDL